MHYPSGAWKTYFHSFFFVCVCVGGEEVGITECKFFFPKQTFLLVKSIRKILDGPIWSLFGKSKLIMERIDICPL